MAIIISEKRVLQILLAAALYLSLQSIAATAFEYSLPVNGSTAFIHSSVIFVNVTFESNLPSWYSTLLIAASAALVALIAYLHHRKHDRFTVRWAVLSVIFFYLSLDEATALHERFTEPLRLALNTENFLYFAWSIVGALFVMVVAFGYWRLLWALPPRIRRLLLLSALIYVGGALFIDAVSAFWFRDDNLSLTYHAIATIEEFCEMTGISLFIYALLSYLHLYVGSVQLTIGSPETAVSAEQQVIHKKTGTFD
ncbi:MAG: hypothetical protein U0694_17670 [Anaerolineae bacterium]